MILTIFINSQGEGVVLMLRTLQHVAGWTRNGFMDGYLNIFGHSCLLKNSRAGLGFEPGPLTPSGRIIPLEQQVKINKKNP